MERLSTLAIHCEIAGANIDKAIRERNVKGTKVVVRSTECAPVGAKV